MKTTKDRKKRIKKRNEEIFNKGKDEMDEEMKNKYRKKGERMEGLKKGRRMK
jgi:hypothetical protein